MQWRFQPALYFRAVRKWFLAVGCILIALEFLSRVPIFTQFSLILATPIILIAKGAGAFFIGHRMVQAKKLLPDATIAGMLYGVGIACIVLGIMILRKISFLQPEFFGIFGGFDFIFLFGSEILSGALFSAIGGIVAGAGMDAS